MNSIEELIQELLRGGGQTQRRRTQSPASNPFSDYFDESRNRTLWRMPVDEDPWDGVMSPFARSTGTSDPVADAIEEDNLTTMDSGMVDAGPGGRGPGSGGIGAPNNQGATGSNRETNPGQDNSMLGSGQSTQNGMGRPRSLFSYR